MTSGTIDAGGDSLVAELIQSRNASASEALAIFRAQSAPFSAASRRFAASASSGLHSAFIPWLWSLR